MPHGGKGTGYDQICHGSEVNGGTGKLPVARDRPCVGGGSNRSNEKCASENRLARGCSYDEQAGENKIAIRFHFEEGGWSGPFRERNSVSESGASRRECRPGRQGHERGGESVGHALTDRHHGISVTQL